MVDKFDKWDRKSIVALIQETFGVTLSAVGRRDIWLRDESGAEWWILGGKGYWHAIPREMMDSERVGEPTGQFVIARKLTDSLDVYVGSLQPLIAEKHSLRTRKTAYQFNVDAKRDSMRVVEAPSVVLKKIGTIPHTDSDRESAKNAAKVANLLKSLSPDERDKLLKKWSRKGRDG